MDKKTETEIKGLKIRVFNNAMIFLSVVLYALLISETIQISTKYEELVTTTQDYINCVDASSELQTASDYLTAQVRLYTFSGDSQYMQAYFEELNENCRREHALTELQKYHADDEVYDSLADAMECSDALTATEFYAMRLVAETQELPESELPEELQAIELNEVDLALSQDEQLEKAHLLVSDENYQSAKDQINEYVTQAIQPIQIELEQRQITSEEALQTAIRRDRVLLLLLMVFNVINFAVVTRLVVSPLFRYIQSIKKEQAIPAEGAYELCYLANTYNEIYNRNAENEAILRREAERDAVTGIMNRSAFDHVTTRMTNADTPLALLLVDVDHFKSVNDTYGHSEGDAALKKVAQLLQSSFRATDYVARIGGDEFAVLMCNITPEQGDVIRSKVQRINEALRTESLAGHQLSISVGAAFSPNGYSKTLFENADQALYVVKENGRRGCAFYEKKAENDA